MEYSNYLDENQLNKIKETKEFSEKRLEEIRNSLGKLIQDNYGKNKSFSIVTTGSYARKEASEQSDLDFFIIFDDESELNDDKKGNY